MVEMIGVYAMENLHNGKMYVGSSHDMQVRRQDHFCLLHKGKHPNIHLQRAWDKYGADAFKFIVLDETDDPLSHEQTWIDMARMDGVEIYNINLCVSKPPMLGKKQSEEARRKIGEAQMGNKNLLGHLVSKETRRKISKALTGRKRSEETKRKISLAMMGHPVSKEARRRIGEANRNRPPISEETRRRMSEVHKK